jgi:hypothetical protein
MTASSRKPAKARTWRAPATGTAKASVPSVGDVGELESLVPLMAIKELRVEEFSNPIIDHVNRPCPGHHCSLGLGSWAVSDVRLVSGVSRSRFYSFNSLFNIDFSLAVGSVSRGGGRFNSFNVSTGIQNQSRQIGDTVGDRTVSTVTLVRDSEAELVFFGSSCSSNKAVSFFGVSDINI